MALDIGAIFKIKAGVEGQQQLDRLNASLRDTEGQGNRLGSVFGGLKGKIIGAFSVAAVVEFGRQIINAASEAEQASNRINAVLKATGHSAGLAKFEIDELADSLAATTQFDDESIRNAAAQFLKFGNIQGEVFKDGIRLSADFAAMMGTDVASAAQTVGKALQSPAEGLMTLERQMGKLDPATKKNIENLMEMGRLSEAQAEILKVLQGRVGGVAQEMNTGLLGATTGVKKAWDEMLEAFGKTAAVKVPVESFFGFLKDSLNDIKRIVEDDSWTQKLKGIGLFALGFRGFDMSPAAAPSAAQQDQKRAAEDAAARAAQAEHNARLEAWTAKRAEEMRKAAADAAKKQRAENQKLLDEGRRGWVAYAEEVFRLADEENLALAKIADDEAAHVKKLRDEFIELIDPLEKYREQLKRIDEAQRLGAVSAADAGEARRKTQQQMEKQIEDEARSFATVKDAGTDAMKELQQAVEGWGRAASSAFTDWAFGAKGSIKDVAATMLKEFANMMLYKNVFAPLSASASSALPGLLAGIFHGGGTVGAGGGSRMVSPAVFAGAPRMHSGGVAGLRSDEVPAILQTGERVLPRGASAGGTNVVVNVNMQQGTTDATANGDGGRQLGKLIGDTVRGVLIDEQRPGGLLARA